MFSSCSFDQDDPGKAVFEKDDEIQKVKSWYENTDHTKNSSKANQLRMRLASPFGDFEKIQTGMKSINILLMMEGKYLKYLWPIRNIFIRKNIRNFLIIKMLERVSNPI
jgi:hypothetical protein